MASPIKTAFRVEPRYIRLGRLDSRGKNAAYWVDAKVFREHEIGRGGDFEAAAEDVIRDSLETQSIFGSLESAFQRLNECVEELSLGVTPDIRGVDDTSGSVQIIWSLDGPRLCFHAMPPDGGTRLYVAVNDDNSALDWRLETFAPNDPTASTVLGEGAWPMDLIGSGERTQMMMWAIASLTGPVLPAPKR